MIGFVVFGLAIGVIARLLVPGRQHIGIALTVLLGLVGSVVGGVVANSLGRGGILRLNYVGSAVAIASAASLIVIGEVVAPLRRQDRDRRDADSIGAPNSD